MICVRDKESSHKIRSLTMQEENSILETFLNDSEYTSDNFTKYLEKYNLELFCFDNELFQSLHDKIRKDFDETVEEYEHLKRCPDYFSIAKGVNFTDMLDIEKLLKN